MPLEDQGAPPGARVGEVQPGRKGLAGRDPEKCDLLFPQCRGSQILDGKKSTFPPEPAAAERVVELAIG
jgi:hypothetical protein